jgi:hypothetical protein
MSENEYSPAVLGAVEECFPANNRLEQLPPDRPAAERAARRAAGRPRRSRSGPLGASRKGEPMSAAPSEPKDPAAAVPTAHGGCVVPSCEVCGNPLGPRALGQKNPQVTCPSTCREIRGHRRREAAPAAAAERQRVRDEEIAAYLDMADRLSGEAAMLR